MSPSHPSTVSRLRQPPPAGPDPWRVPSPVNQPATMPKPKPKPGAPGKPGQPGKPRPKPGPKKRFAATGGHHAPTPL